MSKSGINTSSYVYTWGNSRVDVRHDQARKMVGESFILFFGQKEGERC